MNRLKWMFLYFGMLFTTLLVIPVAKTYFGGNSGPHLHFWVTMVAAPLGFVLLAVFQSSRIMKFHFLLLFLGALFVWFAYPENPLMEFQRQVSYRAEPVIVAIYFLGCLANQASLFSKHKS